MGKSRWASAECTRGDMSLYILAEEQSRQELQPLTTPLKLPFMHMLKWGGGGGGGLKREGKGGKKGGLSEKGA